MIILALVSASLLFALLAFCAFWRLSGTFSVYESRILERAMWILIIISLVCVFIAGLLIDADNGILDSYLHVVP